MKIDTISVFPEFFDVPMSSSIMGRARDKGILDFHSHDLRDYTHDVHKTTDDTPYGGGPGMVMKVEPIFEAVEDITAHKKPTIIFMTPKGMPLTQEISEELSTAEHLVVVCGHYEGFDERAFSLADMCISIGDYVLTGGEIAALVMIDSVVRLLPDVLGDDKSIVDESFGSSLDRRLEYPQYTRPASFRGMDVPEVLLSGNHARIEEWRRQASIDTTKRLRQDLMD